MQPTPEVYKIDLMEGVSFERKDAPTPNFHNLLYGMIGMEHVYRQLKADELGRSQGAMIYYTPWELGEAGIVSCLMNWFGITLVNHVRLAGMICYLVKHGKRDADLLDASLRKNAVDYTNDYTKQIIPDVLSWRNKIGAHYAFTDPRKDDSLQDLQQSIMHSVSWVRERWRSCGMRWHGSQIPEWSPTEEIERLAPRYWPHFRADSPSAIIPGSPSNNLWSPGPTQNGVPTGFVYKAHD